MRGHTRSTLNLASHLTRGCVFKRRASQPHDLNLLPESLTILIKISLHIIKLCPATASNCFFQLDARMDPNSDVDMSWVELASGEIEVKTLKRVLSLSSVGVYEEVKRSKVIEEDCLFTEGGTERGDAEGDFGAGMEVKNSREAQDKMVGVEVECIGEDHGTSRHPETRRVEEQEEDMERRWVAFEKQCERDEKTAFWTTPGLRPLAEPPIMDWEHVFRTWIPSDIRYTALFPHDPEKRAARKDQDGEKSALREYRTYAQLISDDPETGNERAVFYTNLWHDLIEDYGEVEEKAEELWETATSLSRFEYKYLDNDGKTTRLEQWISKGADVFHGADNEIKQKYKHLVQPNFVQHSLATFEFLYMGFDGRTDPIEGLMEKGEDVLAGWPQEVQDKYGYLRRWLPRPPPIVPGTPTSTHSERLPNKDELSIHLDSLRLAEHPRGGRSRSQRRWSIA